MKKTDKSGFYDGLGTALIILALFLGAGGCQYLVKKGESLSPAPLVIKTNNTTQLSD